MPGHRWLVIDKVGDLSYSNRQADVMFELIRPAGSIQGSLIAGTWTY